MSEAITESLKAYLATRPDLATLQDNDVAMAINGAAGAPEIVETMVNERTVFGALGAEAGEAFMSGIESAATAIPSLKRPVSWMSPEKAGVDMGNELTRTMLLTLAGAGYISSESVTTLLALAERSRSLAQELFGRDLMHIDVARARAL